VTFGRVKERVPGGRADGEAPRPEAGEAVAVEVAAGEAGSRLDVFLSRAAGISRSQAAKAVTAGGVTVNDGPAKASYRLREGDRVVFRKPRPAPCEVVPEDIPLRVLYEDPHLIVIDKPAGMVVHPAAGNYRGTLVNALLHHCGDLTGIGAVLRPGIVHRLDKGTSGVLVAAKTEEAHEGLARQFRDRRVKKVYLALCHGDPRQEEGIVSLPVGRHPVERKKMSVRSRRGKEAVTRWRVRERLGDFALLEVVIETGRTHQIRVHLNAVGHPVVGDAVYGRKGFWRTLPQGDLRRLIQTLGRQALHAWSLTFSHPWDGRPLTFTAPLPADIEDLLNFLRGRAHGG